MITPPWQDRSIGVPRSASTLSRCRWLPRVIAILVAAVLALIVAVTPASAEVDTIEQEELTSAEAKAVLNTVKFPDKSASGYAIDKSDASGWTLPGLVTFASYDLDTPDSDRRSFIGVYLDKDGEQLSTVEIVYSAELSRAWTNGVELAQRAPNTQLPQTRALPPRPTTPAGFCWWLNKYADGEIALSALVAAAGGVTALFSGPAGAAIAAAGGLRGALAGGYKWFISLFCD